MDLSLFLDLWLAYEGLDLDLEGGLFAFATRARFERKMCVLLG